MCTSLDCGSQWWPADSSSSTITKCTTLRSGYGDEVLSLQRVKENQRVYVLVGLNTINFLFLSSKFDTLIQAQARELSHLRQRLREGRGVCNILTQHLGDTTKAFEELLRANDIDYYMGQSFREQLAQSSALAQRVSAKISGRLIMCVIKLTTSVLSVCFLQENILRIQMRRLSCSPSGQCSFPPSSCLLCVI
uniref:Uncharacterized protein n=1 Tax=Mastacembelus armatus TaxID=205130 RepID=A0A3Q3M672_9TELE